MRFVGRLMIVATAMFAISIQARALPVHASPALAIEAPTLLSLTAAQEPPQPPKAEVSVKIDADNDTVWYVDPLWIAVGILAAALVIGLIVAASRNSSGGGSTTVIK